MSSDSYRLTYFNALGAAEISRTLFFLAKVQFEDVRIDHAQLAVLKDSGDLAANLDRVPVLKFNGTSIGQSKTIERFLAKKFGFFGSNELEEATVDMICEHCRDVKQKYYDIRAGKTGAELEHAKLAYWTHDLPSMLGKIEKLVPAGGFTVGTKTSLADIYFFNMVYDFFEPKPEVEHAFAQVPHIKAIADNVKLALADYLAHRPVIS